jgi:hypothetical protein
MELAAGPRRNPDSRPPTRPLQLLWSIVIARIATGGFGIELLTLGRHAHVSVAAGFP